MRSINNNAFSSASDDLDSDQLTQIDPQDRLMMSVADVKQIEDNFRTTIRRISGEINIIQPKFNQFNDKAKYLRSRKKNLTQKLETLPKIDNLPEFKKEIEKQTKYVSDLTMELQSIKDSEIQIDQSNFTIENIQILIRKMFPDYDKNITQNSPEKQTQNEEQKQEDIDQNIQEQNEEQQNQIDLLQADQGIEKVEENKSAENLDNVDKLEQLVEINDDRDLQQDKQDNQPQDIQQKENKQNTDTIQQNSNNNFPNEFNNLIIFYEQQKQVLLQLQQENIKRLEFALKLNDICIKNDMDKFEIKFCIKCRQDFTHLDNEVDSCQFHDGKMKFYSCQTCGADQYYDCCNQCKKCNEGCKIGKHCEILQGN